MLHSVMQRMAAVVAAAVVFAARADAQANAIAGVVSDNGKPVEAAQVHAERSDRSVSRDAITDAQGHFRIATLRAGVYVVIVRRVGYRSAELPGVRVADGQTVTLNVSLTQAPRQLSTIQVVTSPTSIDATTPELTMRLDRTYTALLPSAREASSLIALVPGARKDQLWGGAPGVSNDYQIDGVSMNHPGVGGDFLSLSVDWIDALDVRGLGAGAEHGNFQGGIINAITKTGGNAPQYAVRTNYESARLTASNFNANEQGVEQAGRREVAGEALGPISRDRLFYFVAGQMVSRDMRSPNLTTPASDFQSTLEEHLDARGIAKLTWLPAVGQRVDLLGGWFAANANHAGINGVDDPTATVRVRQPTTFYGLTWNNTIDPRNVLDARIAGFVSSSASTSYDGPDVPAVQSFKIGRTPTYQNAIFDERREPASIAATLQWRTLQDIAGSEHAFVAGAEVSRGRWRNTKTRNGGMTWRPFTAGVPNFDPFKATTWQTIGSDWGGEVHLDSDVASEALYLQDYFSLGSRVTVTPGVRYGSWAGYIHPQCSAAAALTTPCYRFEAVHATGVDPRIGAVWDVTGRNTLAIKAHWGRYHQGMYSLFFDRARFANVYTNSRFYVAGPAIIDSRRTYTAAERDAPGSGFSTTFQEKVQDESGRVENYRQPYVDQTVLGIEKSIGGKWKAEAVYTNRRNGDIVGLIDRNIATNYSPVFNTSVNHRFAAGRVLDAHGDPLVIPVLYVANRDLIDVLARRLAFNNPGSVAGYDTSFLRTLTWNPDVVLTTIPQARRHYQQLTLMLRSYQASWRGEGSVSFARLEGNVPGVTGYGTTGSEFSAGPFVRRNEAINSSGFLPDAHELEGKVWATVRLPYAMQGGAMYTHILGERFAPTFEFLNRYAYTDSTGKMLPDPLFLHIYGQSLFVEPRGARRYASRDLVDLHWEWRTARRATITADLFNAFGANALTSINTNIGDQDANDPTSVFGAARLRVAPRTLRVGLRID